MRSERILELLPGAFQASAWEGSPLLGLVAAMEALHAPSEAALDDLDATFDPRRAPPRFAAYLAHWVDLDRIVRVEPVGDQGGSLAVPTGRLRELVAEAAELSRWRGTAYGLRRFLEVATGVEGIEVDEHVGDGEGRTLPFHVRVRLPAHAAVQRTLVHTIVASEKPAYVTSEVRFAEEADGPPPPAGGEAT